MRGRTKTGKIKKGYRADGTKASAGRRTKRRKATAGKRRTTAGRRRRTGARHHKGTSLMAIVKRVQHLEHFQAVQMKFNRGVVDKFKAIDRAYGHKLGRGRTVLQLTG